MRAHRGDAPSRAVDPTKSSHAQAPEQPFHPSLRRADSPPAASWAVHRRGLLGEPRWADLPGRSPARAAVEVRVAVEVAGRAPPVTGEGGSGRDRVAGVRVPGMPLRRTAARGGGGDAPPPLRCWVALPARFQTPRRRARRFTETSGERGGHANERQQGAAAPGMVTTFPQWNPPFLSRRRSKDARVRLLRPASTTGLSISLPDATILHEYKISVKNDKKWHKINVKSWWSRLPGG